LVVPLVDVGRAGGGGRVRGAGGGPHLGHHAVDRPVPPLLVVQRFQQVVHGAEFERVHRFVPADTRDEHQARRRAELGEHPRHLHAGQARHVDVAEHRVHRRHAGLASCHQLLVVAG